MADPYPSIKPKGDSHPSAPKKIDVMPMLRDIVTGAAKGNTADLVGAPVDVLNTLLSLPTAVFSKNSVDYGADIPGGSETIRTLAGVEGKDKSVAETLGTNISIGGLGKAMIVALSRAQKVGKVAKNIDAESIKALDELGLVPKEEMLRTNKAYVDSDNIAKTIISDKGARINPRIKEILQQNTRVPITKVVDHPELFAMYPELKKITVGQVTDKRDLGRFSPKKGELDLNLDMLGSELKPTILHELQHGVQTIEKFGAGGNTEQFRGDAKKLRATFEAVVNEPRAQGLLKDLEKRIKLAEEQAFIKYENLPGEQEARFTQTFQRATEEDLINILGQLISKDKTPQSWQTQQIPIK